MANATTTPTTKKAQIAFIRETYSKLAYMGSSFGWQNHIAEIHAAALTGEKKHRLTWSYDGNRFGISATDAAKLFTVRNIAKYLSGAEALLTIVDVIDCRPDHVLACAVAVKYGEQLRPIFTEEVTAQALALDYVELIG